MGTKTAELTGAALDWAVAKCLPDDEYLFDPHPYLPDENGQPHYFKPSTDWTLSGPIIERERIEWQWLPSSHKAHQYGARKPSHGGMNRTFCMDGPNVLVAAMRCYVASRLGDEVEVPEELQ